MTKNETEDQDLLDDIRNNPDDDARRLIYADWLEKHDSGDGKRAARAEFIRTQVALAGMPQDAPGRDKLERQEQELLAQHRADWEQRLRSLPLRTIAPTFQRGLIHGITIDAEDFPSHAKLIFACAPTIREVRIKRCLSNTVHKLLNLPYLAQLTSLQIGGGIHAPELQALAASPLLASLTSLDLSHNAIDAEGARALANSPYLAQLTSLNLGGNSIGDTGLQALASSPHLANLKSLELDGNEISASGARALASSSHLRQLTSLNLNSNRIGDAGLQALAGSRSLAGLRSLDIGGNGIMAGVRALASSPHLRQLTSLNLGGNNIRDVGVEILAASPNLAEVRSLKLTDNYITDIGVRALAASPYTANLTDLKLSNHMSIRGKISNEGARALANTPHLAKLRSLDLSDNSGAQTVKYEERSLQSLRAGMVAIRS